MDEYHTLVRNSLAFNYSRDVLGMFKITGVLIGMILPKMMNIYCLCRMIYNVLQIMWPLSYEFSFLKKLSVDNKPVKHDKTCNT